MNQSRSLPPLGWFRAFERAAIRLSFTAAADELGLTQSAVSQQIRSLESRLGCRLFIRKHRGIALTDEGRKLLPDITRAIDAIRTATAPFKVETNPEILTIATSVSVAQWYLAPALRQFVKENNGVQVRLLTSVWPDAMADSTDVQIRFGPAKDNGLHELPLGDNKLVLVAAPHILQGISPLNLNDEGLDQYPLIQAVGTSDTWTRCAHAFGFTETHEASLFVDSHGLAVDFAISGSGVALTSKLIAMPAIASGSLVMVSPESTDAVDGYYIAVSSDQHEALASAFVDWMVELCGVT